MGPRAVIEEHNAAVLAGLSSVFRVALVPWLKAIEDSSITLWYVCGTRTATQQMTEYLKGRVLVPTPDPSEEPRYIVLDEHQVTTRAMPSESPHCRGAALDFCPYDKWEREFLWKRVDLFRVAGRLAKASGLTWGGDFHGFADMDHIEMVDWRKLPMIG